MVCQQNMSYNSPNTMYISQIISGVILSGIVLLSVFHTQQKQAYIQHPAHQID